MPHARSHNLQGSITAKPSASVRSVDTVLYRTHRDTAHQQLTLSRRLVVVHKRHTTHLHTAAPLACTLRVMGSPVPALSLHPYDTRALARSPPLNSAHRAPQLCSQLAARARRASRSAFASPRLPSPLFIVPGGGSRAARRAPPSLPLPSPSSCRLAAHARRASRSAFFFSRYFFRIRNIFVRQLRFRVIR